MLTLQHKNEIAKMYIRNCLCKTLRGFFHLYYCSPHSYTRAEESLVLAADIKVEACFPGVH